MKINHPNVIKTHECYVANGLFLNQKIQCFINDELYIIMIQDYCPGEDLLTSCNSIVLNQN